MGTTLQSPVGSSLNEGIDALVLTTASGSFEIEDLSSGSVSSEDLAWVKFILLALLRFLFLFFEAFLEAFPCWSVLEFIQSSSSSQLCSLLFGSLCTVGVVFEAFAAPLSFMQVGNSISYMLRALGSSAPPLVLNSSDSNGFKLAFPCPFSKSNKALSSLFVLLSLIAKHETFALYHREPWSLAFSMSLHMATSIRNLRKPESPWHSSQISWEF